jgi:hypothetical protein
MKVINAQQARVIRRYKNTEDKLPKASAAVWLNEICGLQHSTPKYIQDKEQLQTNNYHNL